MSYMANVIRSAAYGVEYPRQQGAEMDKNEFFRLATLSICGSLQIETALHECVCSIRNLIPIDRMFLMIYEPSLGAMRTLAMGSSKKSKKLDWLTPLPQAARDDFQYYLNAKPSGAIIIDSPQNDLVAREMLRGARTTDWSVMCMELSTQCGQLGQVALTAKGANRYKKEHADLLSMLQKPFAIAFANTLRHRQVHKLKDLLADDNRFLHGELRDKSCVEIVGANVGLRDVMYKVRQVASLDSPVLLLGETGTGKDVIANAIHYSSSRSEGPFVSVNCGAIPDTLVDSELFGHEKGAFTGALAQKRGRFERAHTGTIFLDEIGDLPLHAQVRLLKVLQSKEIERVGGIRTISLDIRVIAATNRNLEEMVKDNTFREDLWFRLNVFPIQIPPLRERQSDIPALIHHFINHKARELKLASIPELAPGVIDPLTQYHWPGNVRELENVIERAIILNPKGPLTFEHLYPGHSKNVPVPMKPGKELTSLDEVISRHIHETLSKTNGKVSGSTGAAAVLKVNPSTLRNRMKKLGIVYEKR